MRKNRFLLLLLALLISRLSFSQVAGLSYTFAPSGEHVWWHDQAGLENGLLVGGKLGFGFGEFFELRGSYLQGLNLKTDFTDFGLRGFDPKFYNQQEVELTRWGGEIKANISRGRLLPFLLLGTGVQSIALKDAPESQQIYLTAGAGITVGLADRLTLILEARNTAYRYGAGIHLLTDQDKADLGVSNVDFMKEELNNWSIGAAIQLYLGGRSPGKMSELDKAYFKSFTGSSGGLNLGLEAVVGQINFDNDLIFRDTRVLGASAGFDLGPYIGIRGFYWKGMEKESWTKFDELSLWGGEMRMRLNTSGGIVPFIMLGGGKLDVQSGYQPKASVNTDTTTNFNLNDFDTPFAMGGAGLLVPLTKNFKIFGSARVLLTSTPPLDDLYAPEEVNSSWFYSAGIKLNFGKKNRSPEEIVNQQIADQLAAQKAKNDARAEALKQQYEQRIVNLEQELIKAYEENDLEKAAVIKKEKEEVKQVVQELENREAPPAGADVLVVEPTLEKQAPPTQASPGISVVPSGSEIRMTPAEFQNLIEEIFEGTDNFYYQQEPAAVYPGYPPAAYDPSLVARLEALEKSVAEEGEKELIVETKMIENTDTVATGNDELKIMLIELERKLDRQNEEMKRMNQRLGKLENSSAEEAQGEVKRWRLFKGKNKKKDGGS